ncbi:MAG: hypothetical protein OEL75_00440, partial [Kiritimatiellaceae bacterium]|nr:hypothetical protein [Kiritimatiellaceae bacterium]
SQALDKMDGDFQLFEKTQQKFHKHWKTMREQLEAPLDTVASASLMSEIERADKTDYIAVIQSLGTCARTGAYAWLQSIVDEAAALWA